MEGMDFEDLAELLKPCLSQEFLASSWGKSFKHISGKPGKFARLLPWNALNEILNAHRLDYPRLRLMQDGKSLPTSTYIRHVGGGNRKPSIPRLSHPELENHLRSGATLVLDAVDELYDPIRRLACGLERIFHERIQVNCYAGWRVARGFDLHWDDHDVFIVQVTGRKRWSIYGMTTPYPLKAAGELIPKPTHEPIWSDVLEDGDVLYIPRGWWHVAIPLDEPTLHLTVGIHNRNGVDFIQWFGKRLNASEALRMDLPRFERPEARLDHMEKLRQELIEKWDAELLSEYFDELDAMADSRAVFSLPESAIPEAILTNGATLLRLTTPRRLDLKVEGGELAFASIKKKWRFAPGALLVLRPLNEGRACSISALCEAASDELDEITVRAFLRELLFHGLVAVVQR